jgi:hypothetical protein
VYVNQVHLAAQQQIDHLKESFEGDEQSSGCGAFHMRENEADVVSIEYPVGSVSLNDGPHTPRRCGAKH